MAKFDIRQFDCQLVMELQSDLIEIPGSRIVAPLRRKAETPDVVKGLHPSVVVDGESLVLAVHLLAAVPIRMLKPSDQSASFNADEITRALDLLFQGY